ncbi:hypothetical protein AB4Y43_01410 [Paraburkholderia sp. BR10872]|uniref:hypothetical protein n=1 Tax=Paraburkholderia sp. BR10872 TaxID=3236989 RepID=UPI0034D1CB2F
MSTFERTLFQLGYQISPVILTDGLAAFIPGGMLPIVALTQPGSFALGLLQGNVSLNLDSFFAQFRPLQGTTLVSNQIGKYPFANQAVAANAIIAQPLNVSLLMACPANSQGGYISKLMTMSALKTALDAHNAAGGTYTVATPSYIYTGCILTSLRDVSSGAGKQVQTEWQWDFERPLISQSGAAQALNGLMNKIAGGLPFSGVPAWSGVESTIGNVVSGASSLTSSLTGAVASAVPTPTSIVTALP